MWVSIQLMEEEEEEIKIKQNCTLHNGRNMCVVEKESKEESAMQRAFFRIKFENGLDPDSADCCSWRRI